MKLALEIYNQAINLNSKNTAKYHLNTAACFYEMGQYAQSVAAAQTALQLHSARTSVLTRALYEKCNARLNRSKHMLKLSKYC